MQDRYIALAVLAGGIALSGIAHAQAEKPVGLILAAEDAGLQHPNRPEINVSGGDLLLPGDKVRTRNGSVTLVLCPEGKAATRQILPAGSEITVARDRVIDGAKKLNRPQEVPFCRLPQVEPEPEISSKGIEDLDSRVADPAEYAKRVSGLNGEAQQELNALD